MFSALVIRALFGHGIAGNSTYNLDCMYSISEKSTFSSALANPIFSRLYTVGFEILQRHQHL